MPIKILQAFNVKPTAGDDVKDDDVLAFEQATGATTSNSWGMKFSQLVTYLATKFYPIATANNKFDTKIDVVPDAEAGFAVKQTANGNLSSTGLPLGTIEKYTTAPITNWAQNNNTLTSHNLSRVPDVVQVTGVFTKSVAGWTIGDEVLLGMGAIGGSALSSLGVVVDADNFEIYNSCTIADALLVPHKLNGNLASEVVDQTEVALKLTFIALY